MDNNLETNLINFPVISNPSTVMSGKSPKNKKLVKPTSLVKFRTDVGPIEQQMRSTLEGLTGTQYPDQFDWSVYDKIAARFGSEQPRGGVVFKTSFKLANYHTSCSKCHYAFEIDSYGRGCIHECSYCYAKDQLSAHGYWNRPIPFPVDLSEIRKVFYTVFETDKASKWRDVLSQRVPLRIGSMSDSFMWIDQKYKITQELLRILKFYAYPNVIFTRSDLVAHDDYIKLMDPKLSAIQFSISGDNQKLTKAIEPGAPSVERRFLALKKLRRSGFWTTVRVNPLFPRYPDGYYTDLASINERFGSREQCPSFDLLTPDFFDKLKEAEVPSALAGFVRLSSNSIKLMSKASGVDLASFYRPELLKVNGAKCYSDKEIAYYYSWFNRECMARGIRFNSCYIGNGLKDYFQYQDLWANKKDCCDVKGNVASFSNTSQSVSWSQREKHAPSKDTVEKAKAQESELERIFLSSRENLNPGSP
ncbi:MAG: hypothetical protein K2X47_01340 [Bdellovibrionales bacterium]|nr:hypothetical protein [Bdellovibrionales bacterium]